MTDSELFIEAVMSTPLLIAQFREAQERDELPLLAKSMGFHCTKEEILLTLQKLDREELKLLGAQNVERALPQDKENIIDIDWHLGN